MTATHTSASERRKEKKSSKDDGLDFAYFSNLQTNFEKEYKKSFLFQMVPKKINTSQMHKGKDHWVVRGLEREIVDSLKTFLIALGDRPLWLFQWMQTITSSRNARPLRMTLKMGNLPLSMANTL